MQDHVGDERYTRRSRNPKGSDDVVDLGFGNGVDAASGLARASASANGRQIGLFLAPTVWRSNLRGRDISAPFRAGTHIRCQGVSRDYDRTAGVSMQKPGDVTPSAITAVLPHGGPLPSRACYIITRHTTCKETFQTGATDMDTDWLRDELLDRVEMKCGEGHGKAREGRDPRSLMDKLTRSCRSMQIAEVISNFLRMLVNSRLEMERALGKRRLFNVYSLFRFRSSCMGPPLPPSTKQNDSCCDATWSRQPELCFSYQSVTPCSLFRLHAFFKKNFITGSNYSSLSLKFE